MRETCRDKAGVFKSILNFSLEICVKKEKVNLYLELGGMS
jgi:hypothetical protein